MAGGAGGSREEEFARDPEPVALGPSGFTDVYVWGTEGFSILELVANI